MMRSYLFLLAAIIFETVGTSALKACDQFTRPLPSLVAIVSYLVAFYLLSLTLRTVPIGIAYAIWSGMGIVLVALIGLFWFRQALDTPAVVGLLLIVAGVVVINVLSKCAPH